MDSGAKVIEYLIYVALAIMAAVTAGCFVTVVKGVNKINREIDEKKKKRRRVQYTQDGVQTISDAYTWAEVLGDLKEFSKPQIAYSIAEQLIPIFPLLGILGTVTGLIMQLQSGDLTALKEAMGTSMWTTFWGLLAAIALRLADAIFVSKKVTELELYFDMYEQEYQISKDMNTQNPEA